MYRKIVWCYIIILTLLDISHNSKLTAQGKSHGVSIHDHLVEGITIQEWGADPGADGSPPGAPAALRLSPPALRLGPRALGAPHSATVTVTNLANTTLHLASVGANTPDFHASFFDAKSLPPLGNTSFSVIYLGRHEGPVAAVLEVHSSLGVAKLPVSAEGVESPWGVWPLLGLRVPANATLSPLLTLTNPTDHPVQVSEVYSSAGWVRLSLPAGEGAAPRDAWLLPPRATRPLVRLRITQPPQPNDHTAYVRIKANVTGGGIVVSVSARAAAAGEYADPTHLRVRRGAQDPPDTFYISVGNSGGAGVRLEASVFGARCSSTPPADDTPGTAHRANGNGVKSDGAHLSLLRSHLEPYQELTRTAEFTIDYASLWAGYVSTLCPHCAPPAAWCAGVLRVGRAAVPYVLQLLPGTLHVTPADIQFITGSTSSTQEVEVRVHNSFTMPVRLYHLSAPPGVRLAGWMPRLLQPGASVLIAKVSLQNPGTTSMLDDKLILHTNVTDYSVPVAVHDGRLRLEWEWPGASTEDLELGAIGTSSTLHVRARLHNPAPRALCARSVACTHVAAQLRLHACTKPAVPEGHACRCVPAGGFALATLRLVAPARAGPLSGELRIRTPHATITARLTAHAHEGRVAAHAVTLPPAAPYAGSAAVLAVESSMALRMRVLGARQPPDGGHDPAIEFTMAEDEVPEIRPGVHTVGRVRYSPERLCAPHCYTGLDIESPEGVAWLSTIPEGGSYNAAARRSDRALLAARAALYSPFAGNRTLLLLTDQVRQVSVTSAVQLTWPRLAGGGAAGWAGLAAVEARVPLTVRVRNPALWRPLLLQPAVGPPPDAPALNTWEPESEICKQEECIYAREAFTLSRWRLLSGAAREVAPGGAGGAGGGGVLPMLELGPAAEVEVDVIFAPREPVVNTAYLYLRNNLTIVEGIQLVGRGAFPTFELGGRRPGSTTPLLFEVTGCGSGGVVRRTLAARNTGRVPVRLRHWLVAGTPCHARGFAVAPCDELYLKPNDTQSLTLTFTPDYTLARAHATLEVVGSLGSGVFTLAAVCSPRLLRECSAPPPRTPFEPTLRTGGALLACAVLALVLAAAALDAERLLRRARAARAPAAAAAACAAPLDLRSLATSPAPEPRQQVQRAPPPPPPPRRRKLRKQDPHAESRAFERWRASLRASDETPLVTEHAALSSCEPPPYEPEPEDEPPRTSSGDDDAPSSESESSSPQEADDDERIEQSIQQQQQDDSNTEPPSERTQPERPTAATEGAPRTRRRDAEGRRERRADAEPARSTRAAISKPHGRKDKPSKRRERLPPTPPRSSPPAAEPRPPATAATTRAVPWGATWSSVVARAHQPGPGAPCVTSQYAGHVGHAGHAPTQHQHQQAAGSRPAPDPPTPRPSPQDNSLFYFNGDHPVTRPEPEYGWRASPTDRPFGSPARSPDFLEEPVSAGAYGSIGSSSSSGGSWAGPRAPGAAWPWPGYSAAPGSGAVRPPPGFGSSPVTTVGPGAVGTSVGPVGSSVGAVGPVGTAVGSMGSSVGPVGSSVGSVGPVGSAVGPVGSAPRGPRPFDPFQSLAGIWSRTALDWRSDDSAERQ